MNVHNLYAVSVIRDGTSIVGHQPFQANIHSLPSNLRKGGSISCIVNGRRSGRRLYLR